MEPISRRHLLTGACALLVLNGIQTPTAVANTSVKKLPNGRISVNLKKVKELSKVGGSVKVGNVKGRPVAIARTGSSSYLAFSLSCPHQGVTVSQTEDGWRCEAHGSEFESTGELVFGPATTGLQKLPMKINRGVAVIG